MNVGQSRCRHEAPLYWKSLGLERPFSTSLIISVHSFHKGKALDRAFPKYNTIKRLELFDAVTRRGRENHLQRRGETERFP